LRWIDFLPASGRIHEANYCPACQTDGRLLADRSLSRLLREDWPRTLDELERRRERLAPAAPAVGRQGTK
jgi:formamidopyrimidine-DNA glycosylase